MPCTGQCFFGLAIGLTVIACAGESGPPAQQASAPAAAAEISAEPGVALPIDRIDETIPPANAGEDGWNYQQRVEADLTGDGRAEYVVLTARVELYRGQPAWDDGQPWQVYVEDQAGRRTYLYAQRLQLGTLTMRVTRADNAVPPAVILVEQLPDRLRILEATYLEDGRTSVSALVERQLDPASNVNITMP
jgi:hypothetical protein